MGGGVPVLYLMKHAGQIQIGFQQFIFLILFLPCCVCSVFTRTEKYKKSGIIACQYLFLCMGRAGLYCSDAVQRSIQLCNGIGYRPQEGFCAEKAKYAVRHIGKSVDIGFF